MSDVRWVGWWLAGLLAACGSSSNAPDAGVAPPPDAAAMLTLTSDHDDLGIVFVLTSRSAMLTVTNTGGSPTRSLAVTLEATPMDFAIAADTCSGQTVAPNATCTLMLRFNPMRQGTATATVRVGDGAASAAREITAVALYAEEFDEASPSHYDFGDVPLGTTTSPKMFTVTNTGVQTHGPFTLQIQGADATAFALVNDTCSGASVSPGATCTFGMTFAPQASGLVAGALEITATTTRTVSVQGNGLDPVLRLDLSSKNFGDVVVGASSAPQGFVVTNISATTTGPLVTAVASGNPIDFAIDQATDTCAGTMLAPGAQCSLDIRFVPTQQFQRYTRLSVSSGPNVAMAALIGYGLAAQ